MQTRSLKSRTRIEISWLEYHFIGSRTSPMCWYLPLRLTQCHIIRKQIHHEIMQQHGASAVPFMCNQCFLFLKFGIGFDTRRNSRMEKKCKDYMQCYILDIFELKFCFVYIWVMKRVWHNDLEKLEPYCQGWKLVQWSNYGLQVLPR